MSGRPEIVITTDLASTDNLVPAHRPEEPLPSPSPPAVPAFVPGHARTGSDPTLLSPILKTPGSAGGRPSFDASDDGHSAYAPASPTLSARSSVRFQQPTTLDLRSNQPTADSGVSSLALLSPGASAGASGHRRKLSNATFASNEGTVAEHDSTDPHAVKLSPLPSRPSDLASTVRSASPMTKGGAPVKAGASLAPDGDGGPDDGASARGALDLSADEGVDLGPFAFGPTRLASLVDPKSLDVLREMGGVEALLRGLATHRTLGLSDTEAHAEAPAAPAAQPEGAVPGIMVVSPSGQETDVPPPLKAPAAGAAVPGAALDERRRVYGENALPTRKPKTLLQLMWLALQDKVLIILSVAAVVAFALGLFQDFGTPRPAGEPPVDWVEGVAIMVAIVIVVSVGAVNDWQKERQFAVLNAKKDERGVKVLRGGNEHVVDIRALAVGDVALLEPGEILPADGVFLTGHGVRCDESGATGESDAIRKVTYEDALALEASDDPQGHTDCFLISGSKVLEGYGSYVVIAVGTRSFNGRIMMAMRGDAENTPLQLKLNDLAELIAKLGTAAGMLLFGALMIRFFVELGQGTLQSNGQPAHTAAQKGIAFVNILIIAVTIVVVAVPEGLPLAVTLALAFATKRMTKERLLVRVLGSCETMANASVVCTDKTGTLTQNEMTVVAGSVGVHAKFVRGLAENAARTNADDVARKHAQDFSVEQARLNDVLSPALQTLLNDSVAVNSTAFEDTDPDTGVRAFVGSKTETALLKLAQELQWADWRATRAAANVLQMIPFASARKAMGVVVRRGKGARLYLKGASEILAVRCTTHVVVRPPGADGPPVGDAVETAPLGELEADNVNRTIIFYANQTLRTIALCYRDFDVWPPPNVHFTDETMAEVEYEDLARDLTLIAIAGIEDPLRPGVREAVAKCHHAGVSIKMCTGDNVLTARSIALQCGIYTPGGIVMEGPFFRQLDDRELLEVVPRLQVLARSSPEDKKILVEKLKELGEIVGVTGDGTNDGPALKTAHVGFSMGIAGTEVAKEASDIILMDDNFASVVKAIMWGRAVNDAVRKFLQFQVAVNITAVIITFVSAVASASEASVLSAVQLLWVNIIMDTFAALALATDPASEASLDRKPERASAPLFSVDMYKQIFGQAAYQTAIALIFHFLGARILGFAPGDAHGADVVQTLVFNLFVFAQIFNSFNCRRLDNRLNIFEGMWRNQFFIGITLIEIGAQVLIVFVGGAAFQVTSIGGREWGIAIALGFVSIPLGALIRCIPNGPCERLFVLCRLIPNPAAAEGLPTERPESTHWNYTIDRVRDSLGTFSNVRGGRVRASSFVDRSRNARPSESAPAPHFSSLMAMVPTLIASTVGAGWAPAPQGGLADPARHDPSKSTAALWAGKIEVHPDTARDDYAYRRWGHPSAV